jgi:tetratricopeptide (TPR) repeat protein
MIATLSLLVLLLPAPQEATPEAVTEPAQEEMAAPETTAPSMSADEHIASGLAAFRKRRFAAARGHFQQAVDASPDSAAAHFYLGYTIYKIAEPRRANSPGKQEAAQHFAKAYELDPGFKPTWHGRS